MGPAEHDDDADDPLPLEDPRRFVVKTRTPRPDELSREAFEFIAAIDVYKRRHLRSFLDDEEVIEVLLQLGYVRDDLGPHDQPLPAELDDLKQARQRYREEQGRLFPSWSEIYELLRELGYRRAA